MLMWETCECGHWKSDGSRRWSICITYDGLFEVVDSCSGIMSVTECDTLKAAKQWCEEREAEMAVKRNPCPVCEEEMKRIGFNDVHAWCPRCGTLTVDDTSVATHVPQLAADMPNDNQPPKRECWVLWDRKDGAPRWISPHKHMGHDNDIYEQVRMVEP